MKIARKRRRHADCGLPASGRDFRFGQVLIKLSLLPRHTIGIVAFRYTEHSLSFQDTIRKI